MILTNHNFLTDKTIFVTVRRKISKINLNIIFEIKSTNRKPIYAQLTEKIQLKGAQKINIFLNTVHSKDNTEYYIRNNTFKILE